MPERLYPTYKLILDKALVQLIVQLIMPTTISAILLATSSAT
jgi:hypothetical protein